MANNITTNIKNWSSTLGSNQPDGSDLFSSLPDDLRAIQAAVRTWYEDAEWTDLGHTPTRTGATTFTVTGDQTAHYKAGRGIRCIDGASTFYGIIDSAVYTSLTTVTVTLDSGALTASLSAVAVGIDNSGGSIRTGITPSLGDSSNKLATTGFVVNTAFTGQLPGQTGNNGKFLTTDGSVASWAQASLATGVTGTLPVANGGTGATTLTGIVKGNGTGAMTAAVAGTDYQAALVSGTNIKTLNGNTLLGSGDLSNTSRTFTATGAIASAGLSVALRSDGTVSTIGSYTSSETGFVSVAVDTVCSAYDATSGKVVVCYLDTYVKCVVGTVSGTAISFGTPVSTGAGSSSYPGVRIVMQPGSSKFLVGFRGASNLQAVVGTISGTTITFGTVTTINASTGYFAGLCYCSAVDRFVMFEHTTTNTGSFHLIAISGSTPSVITTTTSAIAATLVYPNTASYVAMAYDSTNDRFVAFYSRSSSMYAIVGQATATALSFGTETSLASSKTYRYMAADFSTSAGKIVLTFVDQADQQGRAIVATVSALTISFGTAAAFTTNAVISTDITYDVTDNKMLIAYGHNDAPYYVKAVVGTISGTSISFSTPATVTTGYSSTNGLGISYTPAIGSAVISYKGASNYGKSRVAKLILGDFNFAANHFLGLSESSASDAGSLLVTLVGGVNSSVSGLTPGFEYYVDASGTLTTTPTSNFKVGRALSATSILVTGG